MYLDTFRVNATKSLKVIFAATVMAVFFSAAAHAATVTWDGEGADENFSTAANWSSDAVPSNGDDLVFPTSVDADAVTGDDRVLNNDLSSFSVASIMVTGNYAADDYDYYEIAGNDLTVTGDVFGNDTDSATPNLDIAANVTLGADMALRAVRIDGSVNIGTNNIALETSTISNGLSGSGTVTIDSTSTTPGAKGGGCSEGAVTSSSPVDGDSSGFSGDIVVNASSLQITPVANHLASNANSITVNSDGTLTPVASNGSDFTINVPMTLNGGTIYTSQHYDAGCEKPDTVDITISSTVTASAAVDVYLSNSNLTFSGTVTGASNITLAKGQSKSASLTVGSVRTVSDKLTTTYSGDQSSSYPYVAENNDVVVEAGATVNNITVSGGNLFGSGQAGTISLLSGTINPGLSPGCLSSGDLVYTGGSVEIELAGTTVCTEYDQQDVTGTVALGTATELNISLLSGFVPAVGNSFVIIANDGTDTVTGTFTDLAEGADVVSDGVTYNISYTGGDGNDVELTVSDVDASATPDAPDTGFGKFISAQPLAFVAIGLTTIVGLAVLNPVAIRIKK